MKRVEIHKIEAKKGEQKETNVQLARQKENMKRKKKPRTIVKYSIQ